MRVLHIIQSWHKNTEGHSTSLRAETLTVQNVQKPPNHKGCMCKAEQNKKHPPHPLIIAIYYSEEVNSNNDPIYNT